MNEELSHLELWMPDIKRYIHRNTGVLLEKRGFSYKRSSFTFKRKHKKNFEEISFVFANHFPVSYRVNFLLQIWNHEVKQVKEAYPLQHAVENYKLRSLVFFMRDFVKGKETKEGFKEWQNDFEVLTNKDLFVVSDTISSLVLDQVIPLCDQLSSLAGLDRFFTERPDWSVNSLNVNNLFTELTTAKLNRKRDFYAVVGQMIESIEKKIVSKEMERETRNAVERFSEYLIRSW